MTLNAFCRASMMPSLLYSNQRAIEVQSNLHRRSWFERHHVYFIHQDLLLISLHQSFLKIRSVSISLILTGIAHQLVGATILWVNPKRVSVFFESYWKRWPAIVVPRKEDCLRVPSNWAFTLFVAWWSNCTTVFNTSSHASGEAMYRVWNSNVTDYIITQSVCQIPISGIFDWIIEVNDEHGCHHFWMIGIDQCPARW